MSKHPIISSKEILPKSTPKPNPLLLLFLIAASSLFKTSNPKSIKFEWRGGLRDNKYTCSSLELQHSIRKEWEENTSS